MDREAAMAVIAEIKALRKQAAARRSGAATGRAPADDRDSGALLPSAADAAAAKKWFMLSAQLVRAAWRLACGRA